MSKRALRKQLGSLLRKNKMGKLYTCSKLHAFKHLTTSNLIHMINFLQVNRGDKVYAYGINQVVSKPFNICIVNAVGKYKSKTNSQRQVKGYYCYQAEQCQYESGYFSCGCGSWSCFADGLRLRSKEEIVLNFKNSLESEWASDLAKQYFVLLESGVDILTDDGFLIEDFRKHLNWS